MSDYHGIIFAYKAYPELHELVSTRTAASLPICARYRLIDFALSSMKNAGISNVGVIMQRDYQSLLDHLGSGKAWDMSKKSDGLRMLPPFGLPSFHKGDYTGTMEALNAVSRYINDIQEDHVVLMIGNLCANIDLADVIRVHESSGAEITAICANYEPDIPHHRFVAGSDGFATQLLFDRTSPSDGHPSLECYVINKSTLLKLMDRCKSLELYRFHRDGLTMFMREGGKIMTYVHTTYARIIKTVDGYYDANMNLLDSKNRASLFPADRPVRTTSHDETSTYYGFSSSIKNSLVANGCVIDGSLENCIVFPGVKVGRNASLKNCIIMRQSVISDDAELNCIIADKMTSFSSGINLCGSVKLPIVVPEYANI